MVDEIAEEQLSREEAHRPLDAVEEHKAHLAFLSRLRQEAVEAKRTYDGYARMNAVAESIARKAESDVQTIDGAINAEEQAAPTINAGIHAALSGPIRA